jgi:hypothetical protein
LDPFHSKFPCHFSILLPDPPFSFHYPRPSAPFLSRNTFVESVSLLYRLWAWHYS